MHVYDQSHAFSFTIFQQQLETSFDFKKCFKQKNQNKTPISPPFSTLKISSNTFIFLLLPSCTEQHQHGTCPAVEKIGRTQRECGDVICWRSRSRWTSMLMCAKDNLWPMNIPPTNLGCHPFPCSNIYIYSNILYIHIIKYIFVEVIPPPKKGYIFSIYRIVCFYFH